MADPIVQRVRAWLQSQPFELRMITLLVFMEEAVEDKFGKDARNAFDKDLKEACRKLPTSPKVVQ